MNRDLRDKAAIAGIGATEFSKNSGRSELRLAIDAVTTALEDAGISPREVDGFSTYDCENTSEIELARGIGAGDLRYFARTPFGGGGAGGVVLNAALAVVSGAANVVVCYRAMNERSEYRLGQPHAMADGLASAEVALRAYHRLHGIMTVGAVMAVVTQRYLYETGTTPDDLAHLAVTSRKHASTNPNAFFYGKPITAEDYLNSRMIADPFRLFDCCQESDGAIALVVTTADRARLLRHPPALIRAAAQGSPKGMIMGSNYYRDDISPFGEASVVAKQLYATAGLGARNIQGAIVYDHFLPTILPALEAYGFCERGEARHFIRDGNLELGGSLPLNTHGGHVGEAYVHGMNGLVEAVRQVRGTAVNQIPNVENMLVACAVIAPTSGLILARGP
jgi:acetyl-CoA acetyltransferase